MEDVIKKEDRRVRRTKKLLMQGLTQLMQRKQLKDITVRELADLVDVNRGTFYIHYKDVFDMLEKVEEELFAKFDRIMLAHKDEVVIEHTKPFLTDLCQFVDENQDMCRVLLSENGDMVFLHRLNDVVREKCHEDWKKLQHNGDETEFEYRYSFVVFGCIGMVRTWLERGCNDDNRKLIDLVEEMIRQGGIPSEKREKALTPKGQRFLG